MKDMRIAIVGDMHCGHHAGLTPPRWINGAFHHPDHPLHKLAVVSGKLWDWYIKEVKAVGAVDMVVDVGDSIDGTGEKSGGTELNDRDRNRQVQAAIDCHRVWKTSNRLFVYGTGYHTGNHEDFENQIAEEFNAKIGSHEWIQVNGITIDVKHHLNKGKNALLLEIGHNQEWAESGLQPRADVLVRGHVHAHRIQTWYSQKNQRHVTAYSNLPLQFWATKFGGRRCSGVVHYGFTVLTITPSGEYQIKPHSPDLQWAAPQPIVLSSPATSSRR